MPKIFQVKDLTTKISNLKAEKWKTKSNHTNAQIFCCISIDGDNGAKGLVNKSDLMRDLRLGKFSKQVKINLSGTYRK